MNIITRREYCTENLTDIVSDICKKAEEMLLHKDKHESFDGEFIVTVEFIKYE